MNIAERLLSRYDKDDFSAQLKVRFLFYFFIAVIALDLAAIVFVVFNHQRNPLYGYSVNMGIVYPLLVILASTVMALLALFRGRFTLAGHQIVIVSFLAIWAMMFLDRSYAVSRLNTVSLILAILSMSPLVVVRNKHLILIYGAVNCVIFYFFAFYSRSFHDIPDTSFYDYLFDNTAALFLITVISYKLYSINMKMMERSRRDLARRIRTENELSVSVRNLNSLMENSSDYILISDEQGYPVIFNKAYSGIIKLALGLDMKPGIKPHTLLPDPDAVEYWNGLHRRVLSGETFREVIEHEIPSVGKRYFEYLFHPIRESGAVKGFSEISRDITNFIETEERLKASVHDKESLLRELFHRTKNNMQLVSSMIALQSSYVLDPDARELFNDVRRRIDSIALVHQMLYQSGNLSRINLGEYLRELSRQIAAGDEMKFPVLEIQPVEVLIDTALPLGLICNELSSLYMKRVRAGNNGGEVTIRVRFLDNGKLSFTYRGEAEELADAVQTPVSGEFGESIINNIVERQLQGTIRYEECAGINCCIEFNPLLYKQRI